MYHLLRLNAQGEDALRNMLACTRDSQQASGGIHTLAKALDPALSPPRPGASEQFEWKVPGHLKWTPATQNGLSHQAILPRATVYERHRLCAVLSASCLGVHIIRPEKVVPACTVFSRTCALIDYHYN